MKQYCNILIGLCKIVLGCMLVHAKLSISLAQQALEEQMCCPIHSLYYISMEALPTTALILCQSQHVKALQATASEGLAQGPYMVARVGFEPATLQCRAPNLPLSQFI